MKDIIIYGIGPLAKLMNYYFTNDSQYNVIGFTVDKEYIKSNEYNGKPVVIFDEVANHYHPNDYLMFVAIGYNNMLNRALLYNKAKAKGYSLVNYISSNANISNDLIIGDNNVLMQGVTVEPFIKVGNNNIFWSNTLLGHDLKIGNHNYISACCLLGGNCTFGNKIFVCNSVSTINGLKIDDNSTLYPGAVIYKNVGIDTHWLGNPAKKIRTIKKNN